MSPPPPGTQMAVEGNVHATSFTDTSIPAAGQGYFYLVRLQGAQGSWQTEPGSEPQRDVDLQISGHTHGGQLWPFHWLVRATVPWLAGLYRVGRSAIYVSRGTGFWGPPMRLGAPSEVTELTLRPAAS